LRRFFKALLGVAVFGAFVWLERRHPLRPRQNEPRVVRNAPNLALAALSAATIQFIEKPMRQPLTRRVEGRCWGLLQQFRMPCWAEALLALLLLDYTLYVWHILTHRVPLLWRFHSVHHIDLDLDASTALRFHFGEMAISVLWRAGQVLLIGVSPRSLALWQSLLTASILFHHSNIGLPISWERKLNRLIVTPRMHGIHHSIVDEETSSNWSSGLTIWDWLHGTLRLNIPQQEITIGLPAIRSPAEVKLPKMLAMPFQQQLAWWELPDGTRPSRLVPTTSCSLLSE
jgi:sterol desaturase/sphingolipid hydroxylase (fatty acid hydroxylase superfamily)